MPEVIITYKSQKTLDALKDFAKYFDFNISAPKKKSSITKENFVINGVTMVRGSGTIDNTEMNKIFSTNSINAKDLRSKWQRKK